MAKRFLAAVPFSFLSGVYAALALSSLGACVIPYPQDRVVGRAVTIDPLTLKVGETTRDEVLHRLGDPDAIWVDELVRLTPAENISA